jgi:hypothetical protein
MPVLQRFTAVPVRLRRLALAVLCTTPWLLTACGGGGGADAGTPLSQTYNLDAAITQALAKPTQLGPLTTTYQNVVFNLTMTFAPAPDMPFEGVTQKSNLQTVVMTGGGSNVSSSSTQYYKTGPYTASGSLDVDGSYTVSVRTGDLPTSATVGASGLLSTDTVYADATKALVTATSVTTWSLESDSATTVLACLNSVVRDVSPPDTSSQKVCFRINAAGEVSGGRITLSGSGITLDFR